MSLRSNRRKGCEKIRFGASRNGFLSLLAEGFGPGDEETRECVRRLAQSCQFVLSGRSGRATLAGYREWEQIFGDVYGYADRRRTAAVRGDEAALYGLPETTPVKPLLFAIHTYYALLLKWIALRALETRRDASGPSFLAGLAAQDIRGLRKGVTDLERGVPFEAQGLIGFLDGVRFSWYLEAWDRPLALAIQEVLRRFVAFDGVGPAAEIARDGDVLQGVYQRLVPVSLRRGLGEHYTPDWLAAHLVDRAGFQGKEADRFLDPSCGSGVFLLQAIRRVVTGAGDRVRRCPEEVGRQILNQVTGYDLNPLAVLACRTNYLIAVAALLPQEGETILPVEQRDSLLHGRDPDGKALLDEPLSSRNRFQFVVGNPPWIRWCYLSEGYRRRTGYLWREYGLFSLAGHETRLGGGEKDLSMLFTYRCADRYLAENGLLAFVITGEAFKSKGAGEGFRRFRLGDSGESLEVLWLEEMTDVRPFGAANKTVLFALRKGRETRYPVPVVQWRRTRGTGSLPSDISIEEARALTERRSLLATPVDPDNPRSSWQTADEGLLRVSDGIRGENDYRAVRGASTEPYGVFWLDVKGMEEGLLQIENRHDRGKRVIRKVSATVEPDRVFPAVSGREILRFGHREPFFLLVSQDSEKRRGFDEERMRREWPLTYTYLEWFRRELEARAMYKKYFEGKGGPFYSMYNISLESFAPFRVVWKRMASRMAATVLSHWATPFGDKPIVATDTTSLLAARSADEAHFLCSVLNGTVVDAFIRSFSSKGRGFGAPSIVKHLAIPRFDRRDATHRALSELSREAHRRVAKGGDTTTLDRQIDAALATLWGLTGPQLTA